MRLTLRTLLAYRDGVLSPADKEDLHRRIQISHDAGNLLKRIGAVTKLNHVLAPPVLSNGIGGDPNSVAEYLDDVLQHTQVPELERNCLVYDMQLAELADCHELLSTAMNTKVTVSASLRGMALAVGHAEAREQLRQDIEQRKAPRRTKRSVRDGAIERIDTAHAVPGAVAQDVTVQVAAPMLASGGESIKPQGLNLENASLAHEVPEYLVGSSSGKWKTPLAIGALAALLGVLVWQTLGPWERVAALFASAPVQPKKNKPASTVDFDLITESTTTPPGIADANETKAAAVKSSTASEVSPQNTEAGTDSISASDGAPPGLTPAVESAAPPGLDASVATDVSSPAPPAVDIAPSPAVPNSTKLDGSARAAIWLPKTREEESAVVLASHGDRLMRVAAGEPIVVPTRLIFPPTARTTIDLPNGVLWTACGASILDLADAADGSTPLPISMGLGRALVRSGPDGSQVRLESPVGIFLIELNSPESLASIELSYRPTAHGSVLDRKTFKPVLIIVAAEAQISVVAVGDKLSAAQKLDIGDGLAIVDGAKPTKFRLQNIPGWYRSSVDRPIDSLAAQDLHELLTLAGVGPQVDISPQIIELSSYRRPETAALAVQLAMLSDDWHPFVNGFLNQDRMRSHWTTTIELARQLLARDPAQASSLEKLFIKFYQEQGTVLFELLCGLPESELNQERVAKVISQLDSPQLAHRILAIELLQRLTGKNLGFQPASPNRASVQQWRREITTSRLVLTPPQDPIWERIPR